MQDTQAAVATQDPPSCSPHWPSPRFPANGKRRAPFNEDDALRRLTDALCLDPGAAFEARRRRLLTFTRHRGKDAWRFGDERNGCFRSITGESFDINGEEVKAPADSSGEAWHSLIGMSDVVGEDRRDVLLIIEGSKDGMAGFHFAQIEGRSDTIGLVVALGSAVTLRDADIRNLRDRRVRLIGDADPAGIEAVNRIAGQLTASSEVQALNLAGLRRVDGHAVKDLFDATRLDYDDFEANRDLSCVTDLGAQGSRVLVFPKAELSSLPPSPPSQLLSFSDSMRTSPISESASMRGSTIPSIEQILAGAIPSQRGETNRLLFNVARRIRQAEESAKLPLLALRHEVAVAWLERARGCVDPTFDVELVELQLAMKMKCVKTLDNPLTLALAALDSSPPVTHPGIPPGSKSERLARLCRNMAQQLGGTFSLSTRDAARAVGYSDNHAGIALLQKLEGIAITCIDKGKKHVGAKASRFQYLLPLDGTHT